MSYRHWSIPDSVQAQPPSPTKWTNGPGRTVVSEMPATETRPCRPHLGSLSFETSINTHDSLNGFLSVRTSSHTPVGLNPRSFHNFTSTWSVKKSKRKVIDLLAIASGANAKKGQSAPTPRRFGTWKRLVRYGPPCISLHLVPLVEYSYNNSLTTTSIGHQNASTFNNPYPCN